jgi:tetratricopeptide (TPR) repeat protein
VRNVILFLAAALCAGPAALAQEIDAKDLENRIDYAYFTEEATALRNLIRATQSTVAKAAYTPEIRYVLGFAQYRLGAVLAAKEESEAAKAMSECVDELDEATDADEQFAEAYALQSACYGQLAALSAMSAMISGPKSGARLDKARKLAPQNPRVALVDALGTYSRPRIFGGDKAQALTKLKLAAELFDKAAPNPATVPSWGHADAYAALGRSLFEAGDTLGARNALERALIIAPEYAAAKRLLGQVTSQR